MNRFLKFSSYGIIILVFVILMPIVEPLKTDDIKLDKRTQDNIQEEDILEEGVLSEDSQNLAYDSIGSEEDENAED